MKTMLIGPCETEKQKIAVRDVLVYNDAWLPPPWFDCGKGAPVMSGWLPRDVFSGLSEIVVLASWREDSKCRAFVLLAMLVGVKVRGYAEVKNPVVPDELTVDLISDVAFVIAEVFDGNSERHGGHVEWLSRMAAYHAGKAAGHAADAGMMSAGLIPPTNGEGAVEHFNAVIVRGAMGRWLANKKE